MDEKPPIDLHPSEWTRGRKLKQPILTPHGRTFLVHFAILLFVGFLVAIPASILAFGKAPYWVDDYITFTWRGLSTAEAVLFTLALIIVPLGIDALLKLLRRLLG